jgi:hypothetical protein
MVFLNVPNDGREPKDNIANLGVESAKNAELGLGAPRARQRVSVD